MNTLPFTMPRVPRMAREVVASFPKMIAYDAEGYACASRFVLIEPGTMGYSPLNYPGVDSIERADELAAKFGADRAPTPAEREAAFIGSMCGWDAPGADPLNYGEAA